MPLRVILYLTKVCPELIGVLPWWCHYSGFRFLLSSGLFVPDRFPDFRQKLLDDPVDQLLLVGAGNVDFVDFVDFVDVGRRRRRRVDRVFVSPEIGKKFSRICDVVVLAAEWSLELGLIGSGFEAQPLVSF